MSEEAETITKEGELARKLSIAGDSTRLKILVLMFDWKQGCVSSVAEATETSVATASYHLNLMADNGFFRRNRDGQTICYQLVDSTFIACLEKMVNRSSSISD